MRVRNKDPDRDLRVRGFVVGTLYSWSGPRVPLGSVRGSSLGETHCPSDGRASRLRNQDRWEPHLGTFRLVAPVEGGKPTQG